VFLASEVFLNLEENVGNGEERGFPYDRDFKRP